MKWLHRKETEEVKQESPEEPTCQHVVLVARWDRPEDVGREDAVSSYRCETCGMEFTRYEAERLRLTEPVRLQRRVGG
jgi:hypothetical protein